MKNKIGQDSRCPLCNKEIEEKKHIANSVKTECTEGDREKRRGHSYEDGLRMDECYKGSKM